MANKKINQLVSKTSILSTDLFGIGDATTGQLFKKTIAELQAAIGGAVISVNGLVGTVVLDTDDIQELATPTNKYFTDARARGAISLTVTGNSGASTYSSGTGVLNVPTYTLAGLGGITASFLSGTSGISYNSTTGVISYSGTVYTDSSIRALLSGGTGISYNSTTGAISYSGTVYTDSSVRALISLTTTGTSGASTYNNTTGVINVPNYTLAGLGGISLTSLSGGTGITYNNTTGAISYSGTVYTDASVRALISASGAVSYNNTTGVISLTSGNLTEATSSVLTITGGTGAVLGSGTSIQVKQATTSVSGFLSSTDWNTFNGKANALSGTTNYVAKFTSSTGIGNSQIFDNGTAVGIGVTPSAWASGTFPKVLQVGNASLVTNGTAFAQLTNNMYYDGSVYRYITSNGVSRITLESDGAITFNNATNGTAGNTVSTTERFKIANTGQATISIASGIYTALNITSPNTSVYYQLTPTGGDSYILGAGVANTDDFCILNSTRSTNYLTISGGASGGKIGIGTTSPGYKLDVIGVIATNSDSAGTGVNGGMVFKYSTVSTSARSWLLANDVYDYGDFAFRVSSTQTGTTYNHVMILTGGGNILMGTTSNNGERLYVSGSIRATGSITANSDISLKKNLLKIENALEKVEQINGYTYELKEDDSKRHAGVIAQEMEKVFPEIVNTGNDGLMGVEYGNISALLIEAIKEQNTKIKNLETLLASK